MLIKEQWGVENAPFSDYLLLVVSKTRNGVTGNGVTRNRVTGLLLIFFFLFDVVSNYFKTMKKLWKNTKKVNKDLARAGSCHERNRRQNIYQVYICVK